MNSRIVLLSIILFSSEISTTNIMARTSKNFSTYSYREYRVYSINVYLSWLIFIVGNSVFFVFTIFIDSLSVKAYMRDDLPDY